MIDAYCFFDLLPLLLSGYQSPPFRGPAMRVPPYLFLVDIKAPPPPPRIDPIYRVQSMYLHDQ